MRRFFVVIPVFLFIMLGACGGVDSHTFQMVIETQTATMWTPIPVTPTPSDVPKAAMVLNTLNDEFRKDADSLERTLDAHFSIIDLGFDLSGNPRATTTLRIHVECDWVLKSSCTEQRAFIVFAHVFKAMKAGVRQKIIQQVPKTVSVVQIKAFNRMSQIGIVEIGWQDLLAFTNNEITGEQLAARILPQH